MTPAVSRRDLILASVGAAIAGAGAGGFPSALFAQAPLAGAEFLALSRELTGKSDLDADVAETLLGGFLATGHGSALAALAEGGAGASIGSELADAIVAAWYTGIFESGSGPAVATFGSALLWDALTFAKPPTECGGETGYWTAPPDG